MIVVIIIPRDWTSDPVYSGDNNVPNGRWKTDISSLLSGAASQGYNVAHVELDMNLGCTWCPEFDLLSRRQIASDCGWRASVG
jgi:hypothetical protein